MVRFFADGEELRADTVVLTGENAQHARVLRLKAGETGRGRSAFARWRTPGK